MRVHLHNLFVPHHGNNHKSKLLHHHSLSKLIALLLLVQLVITGITQVKPGVLGYASNITVNDIVAQTNAQREASGLQPLTFNSTLSSSAASKATDMFADNYWSHNAPDGTSPWDFFNQVGYTYLYAGENLARDFNDSSAVLQAWMNSQTHRDNIMSGRYTEIGVAVVNGILDGQETTLVVQHFGRPAATAPVVPEQAAAEVAPQAQEVAGEKAPEAFPFQTNPEYDPSATQEEVIEITPQDPLPDSELRPAPEANLDSIQIVTTPGTQIPALSSFDLTKSINLALLAVVVIALVFDATLIWHRKTVRRSGKSFIHLVFLLLVGLIIILTNSGNII